MWLGAVLLLILLMLGMWLRFFSPYIEDATQVGYVESIERRGTVFKTYEGVLLPYKEQTMPVTAGQEVLAAIYIDKSKRLAATMNVYEYLAQDSSYRRDDMVRGTVYLISHDFGAFVAVDNKYSALIPQREFFGEVKVGDTVMARVARVKPDGKLDLTCREKAYIQRGKDAERILASFENRGGVLPFTDKASPERIKSEMGMSKNEFKRAIGNLLKRGLIEIETDCIRLRK